jgi:hypothetical protein
MAELAVLTVVARQCQRAGACSLHIDAIAALAGWVPVVVDRLTGEGRMAQIFVARRLEFHLRARQALPTGSTPRARARGDRRRPASSHCSPVVGVLLVVQMLDTSHQGTMFSLLRPLNRFRERCRRGSRRHGPRWLFRPSLRSRFYINPLPFTCPQSPLRAHTPDGACGSSAIRR